MSMVVGPILWHAARSYFSHFTDQRLYAQLPGAAPQPLTTATDMLYADAVLDPHRHRLLCVREDQTAHQRDSVNTVVAIDLGQRQRPGTRFGQ